RVGGGYGCERAFDLGSRGERVWIDVFHLRPAQNRITQLITARGRNQPEESAFRWRPLQLKLRLLKVHKADDGESHEENCLGAGGLPDLVRTRVCELQVGGRGQEARRGGSQELHDEVRARCNDDL